MTENLSNGAQTTLNGAINNSQTTATLSSASGWPAAPFRAAISDDGGVTVSEIILVGARSGTSLSSITRAAEVIADGSQTAISHLSGATISQVLTRAGLIDQGFSVGEIGVKAYNSTTQSIPNSAYTALTFDSESWDTDGFHSTSSNTSRITIPAALAGKYLFIANSQSASNGTGDRYITFWKNGTNIGPQTGQAGSTSTTEPFVSGILDLSAGDYIEVYVFQNSGGSLNYGDASNVYVQTSVVATKLDSGSVGAGVGSKAYNAGTQSIPNNTVTLVTLNSEEFDTNAFHDTVTNTGRFTIPAGFSGIYSLNYGTAATTSATWEVGFRKNGSTLLRGWSGGGAAYFSGATVTELIAGDYVELVAFQTTGSSQSIGNASNADAQTWASIMRIDSGGNGTGSIAVTDGTTDMVTTTQLTLPALGLENGGSNDAILHVLTSRNGAQDDLSTVATSGSSQTLNPSIANVFDITLTASCTFTLGTVPSGVGAAITLILRQDGTGSHTVTWPGSVSWITGSAPTLKTAAAAIDLVTLFTVDGGTTWGGLLAGTGNSSSTSLVPATVYNGTNWLPLVDGSGNAIMIEV